MKFRILLYNKRILKLKTQQIKLYEKWTHHPFLWAQLLPWRNLTRLAYSFLYVPSFHATCYNVQFLTSFNWFKKFVRILLWESFLIYWLSLVCWYMLHEMKYWNQKFKTISRTKAKNCTKKFVTLWRLYWFIFSLFAILYAYIL